MIEFRNVSVRLMGKRILEDVSFTVEEGALTALLGRNGSGKTTLLKCLNGQVRYKGKIFIDGLDASEIPGREKATLVSMLPQILPETSFTVEELVTLGRKPYTGLSGKLRTEDAEYIDRAINECGLGEFREKKVNRISGGERQRAFLAMILAQNTKYIALDEATTYMDAPFENETYRILKMRIREQGRTVISVAHNLTKALREADNAVVMNEGRVLQSGSTRAFLDSGLIETVFGVRRAEAIFADEREIVYL